jgi:hypothetical protein
VAGPFEACVCVGGDEIRGCLADLSLDQLRRCAPVRMPGVYRRQRHMPGRWFSTSTGRFLEYGSLLERDWMLLMDFDREVGSTCEQPLRLRYLKDGLPASHVPDLLVWRRGRPELCDVKSEERLADPAFQTQVHGVRCPQCARVPEVGPRRRWPHDHRGLLSDPSRCWRRHRHALCRVNLAAADATSVADDMELLAAQRRIDTLLDGQLEPTLAGEQLAPPIYLRDLLALCNLLDRHGRVPDEAQPPVAPRGRRLHDHPAELAAVLPGALALADLPDQEALADALRELADRRYHADGQTLTAARVGPVPATLKDALRRALTQTTWARATNRMGFDRGGHRRPDDLDDKLQARDVPQLFWADDYQGELVALFDFDYFTHWLGRRFCSVLLTRMLTPHDWHDAVRYLDLPERFVNDRYHRLFRLWARTAASTSSPAA